MVHAEYDGELFRATFKPREREEERPLTQPKTKEHQQLLVMAKNTGHCI